MPSPHSVAAAAALAVSAVLSAQAPPTPVRVAPITQETLAPRRELTGELRVRSRAKVAAIEPGRIAEIAFELGQRVTAGDVLVRVDDRRLQRDLAQLEAELAMRRAQIGIEEAQATTSAADVLAYRAAESSRKGSVADMTLRAAERDAAIATARVLVAQSEVARTEATLERLRIQLEDTTIKAPFDGFVVERHVEPGEWLAIGAPVAVLVSSGTLEAWIEVPETASADALRGDADVMVRVDALGVQLAPKSLRVVPDVDPRSRRFRLIATLEPGAHALLPGMSIVAELPGGTPRPMLRVPTDAINNDAGGSFVWLSASRPDGSTLAMPVTVRVAWKREGFAYVEAEGLTEGAMVVVEGNERLRPMTPIQPMPATGAAPRKPAQGAGR